jgi:hypothetical protein
MEMIVS